MTESDDDIWEYRSLKRVKRSERNTHSSQHSPGKPTVKSRHEGRQSTDHPTKGRGRAKGVLSQNPNCHQRVKLELSKSTVVKSEEETLTASLVISGSSRVQKGDEHGDSLKRHENERPKLQMKLESFSPRTNASQNVSALAKNKTCHASVDKRHSKLQAKSSCKDVKTLKKKRRGKSGVGMVKTKELKKVREGYCPSCQMPFCALILDSPERHVTECLSSGPVPLPAKDECPHGLFCDVTFENHYKKFTHHVLAEARTRLPTEEARSGVLERQDMNVQQPESPPPSMKSSNPPISKRLHIPVPHTVTGVNENMGAEQIQTAACGESSMVVSTVEERLNQARKMKPNIRNGEDNLRTPEKESIGTAVSRDDESHYVSSNEDIFDIQSSPEQSYSHSQRMHRGEYNPQFEEDDTEDTQSSLQSEISTSILADPGPTYQESQQPIQELPMTLSTQTPVLPLQHEGRDLNSSPSTHTCNNHAQKAQPTCTSCQRNLQTAHSFGLVSKGHGLAQNMNIDFDHCSQVDISIKVTPLGKSRDTKQQSGKMCSAQSFFQMKARKARRIQVMVEENQDSENANSDLEDSCVNSTLTPPLSEMNVKQSCGEQSQGTTCTLKQPDCSQKSKENNSDTVMQHEDMFGNSNTDNQLNSKAGTSTQGHLVNAIPSRPHMPPSNCAYSKSTTTNRPVIKEEPHFDQHNPSNVGNMNEPSSHEQGTLSRIVHPNTNALFNVIPSNSLKHVKQSSLASYFGWGSVKKEKMSQETPNDRAPHLSKLPASRTTIDQIRSSSQGGFGDQHLQDKSGSGHWSGSGHFQGDNGGQVQGYNSGRSQRPCPFYKKIQGTSFVVDAFRHGDIPGCSAYFLSHFHYDHYGGLTRHFRHPIYCSKITANLVKMRIKVAAKLLRPLPMNDTVIVNGVEVTLLEANHCPGAVLFLFRLNDGRVFLHTCDFRADSAMEELPQLRHCHVDQLFLDTTYLDPRYDFPTQAEVMEYSTQVAVDAVMQNDRTLVVCGTYTIGKERLFIAIAEALGCKVFVAKDKKNILDCLEDDHLQSFLTLDKNATRLHVVAMATLSHQNMKQYLSKFSGRYDAVIAFKPTGWTHHSGKRTNLKDIKPSRSGPVSIYGVPYSEHSSYSELRRFVKFIRPNRIIPTVNVGSAKSRDAMNEHFKAWLSEGQTSKQKPVRNSSILNWVK